MHKKLMDVTAVPIKFVTKIDIFSTISVLVL